MPHSPFHTIRPLLASVAALLALSPARATNFTWNNLTGNWSAGGNWIGNFAPSGLNPLDTLTFGGDVNTAYTATNDIANIPFQLNQLILQATDVSGTGNDDILTGNALLLSGAGAGILQNGLGNFTINAPIQLGSSITIGGTGAGVVTLNAGVSGAYDIVKDGPGTLRFGTTFVSPATGPSDNTWFGNLTINNGIVRFNNNAQSGPTALRANAVTINNGSLFFAPKVSDQDTSLRLGTLSGSGGIVQARGQLTSGSQDAEDITIWAMSDGTYAGTIQNSTVGTQSSAHSGAGTFTVRGPAIQTLTGTLDLDKDIVVGSGATLVLGGATDLSGKTSGSVTLQGGSFKLDNRTTPSTDRLRDGSSGSTGVESIGGGSFTLLGNAGGTSETVSRLQLGASNERSGALTVAVQHNAGSSASTVLNFQSYQRDQAAVPLDTVDFVATDGSGNALPLGMAGNNPRILFSTTIGTPFIITPLNGLLPNTVGGDATNLGWATVNGTDFASYDSLNGVTAASTIAAPAGSGTGNATANMLITGSTLLSNASGYSANSIKIVPTAAGQSINLSSAGNLNTGAILLAGSTDFTISGTGGGGIANVGGLTTGPRYFQVQQAVLTVSASLAKINAPVVKAGNGTLVLTNAANVGITQPLVINAGVVRAQSGTSLLGGEIELRGGVLELTGGGTFLRSIGFGPGNLTWSGIDSTGKNISQERGSGGFSAFGADVSVDLNVAGPSDLTWEGLGFVDSGFALIFGSRTANARTTFVDNIGLTQAPTATAANYNAREIQVIDNPSSSADSARLSGTISGTMLNDLLKTGNGLLELTGTNTYLGATLIKGGTLAVNGSIGSSFLTDVGALSLLIGKGTTGPVKVENTGTLAPGDTLGHTSILSTGDLTFAGPTATLSLEIGGITAGGDGLTGYDRLNIAGTVTLNGASLQLASLGGFTATAGQLYFILNNDGSDLISGQFAQGSMVAFGGQTFAISYTANYTGNVATDSLTGGNDIALTLAPEPASGAFLAAAGLGLAARRRRRS